MSKKRLRAQRVWGAAYERHEAHYQAGRHVRAILWALVFFVADAAAFRGQANGGNE